MTKSCCAPRCRNWYKNARRKRRKNKRRVTTLRKLKTKELLVMMKRKRKGRYLCLNFRITKQINKEEQHGLHVCHAIIGILRRIQTFSCARIIFFLVTLFPLVQAAIHGENGREVVTRWSKKRLKDDAVPCIWPGLPAHLTKLSSPRPTSCTSSESRQENTRRLQREAQQERVARDTFNSLDELVAKEGQLQYPADVFKVVRDNYVLFYKLDVSNGSPNMKYTVQVFSDLSVVLCVENERISISQVRSLDKQSINTCTSLNQVFNYLESIQTKLATKEEIIDSVIEKLKDSRFENNDKISFLVEQLSLVFKKHNARRYSPSMLAMTALIERISPACYKQL